MPAIIFFTVLFAALIAYFFKPSFISESVYTTLLTGITGFATFLFAIISIA